MSDCLPAIDIAIRCDRALFLDGMTTAGRVSGRFEVEYHHDALGVAGYDAVTFALGEVTAHHELRFALLSPPECSTSIRVELTADRWTPDPPTYDAYVAAAKMMITPLLRAWNGAHGTRYRLRIDRHTAGRWQPTARTRELFRRFALLANTASLHPLDWQRFYRLALESRQQIPDRVSVEC